MALFIFERIETTAQKMFLHGWDGSTMVVDQDADVRCSDCTLYPTNDECCRNMASGTLSGSCCCGGDWLLRTETGRGIVIDFSEFSVC